MTSNSSCVWEQRWHPLREEWVLFTSHLGGRPWIGDTHAPRKTRRRPTTRPAPCVLATGASGANPPYTGVYWFTNNLRALGGGSQRAGWGRIYQTRPARGTAEVVCSPPDHGKTFVDLSDEETRAVVDLLAERYAVWGPGPRWITS